MFSLIYMVILLIVLLKLLQQTRTVNAINRCAGSKGEFHRYVVSGRYDREMRKGESKTKQEY